MRACLSANLKLQCLLEATVNQVKGTQIFKPSAIRVIALSVVSALLGIALAVGSPLQKASAATADGFSPGNIISDSVMFDGLAFSPQSIQAFLNAQVPRCALGDSGKPAGGTYYIPGGGQVTLANNCLKDYSESVPNIAGDNICTPLSGGLLSAAEIIYRVGVSCNVSQKVLIVLLEKEQSLITHTFPSQSRYSSATGFNCPDTAPCSVASAGFFRQLYSAARQLQVYGTGGFNWFPVGAYSNIRYHPNEACGSSSVFIQNRATAALYYYTPYQPNAAALAPQNFYGTGDSCSAYGNRNFWRIYTDWFGSTLTPSTFNSGVFARDTSGNLWIYPGSGNGSWYPPTQVGTGWQGFTSISATGDISGDGNRDVLGLDSTGTIWLYPSNGISGWGTRVQVVSGLSPSSTVIAPGDFDANGVPDFIVRDPNGDLWLYAGLGHGRIASPKKIGNGWSGFTAIFGAGDMNSDGLVDLVARSADGLLWLYPSAGGGLWKTPIQIGWGWQGMTSISGPGDFDGDGIGDVMGRHSNGGLYLYSGNGIAGFKSGKQIGVGWQGMDTIFGVGKPASGPFVDPAGAGDLNSDGGRDVLAVNTSQELWLYPGNKAGAWGVPKRLATNWSAGDGMTSVGDFNEDGIRDFMVKDSSGSLNMFSIDSQGNVSGISTIGSGWTVMNLIIGVGDMSGDGHSDLLARDTAGTLWLYPGNGSGGWLSRIAVGNGWQTMSSVFYAGDFSGDGLPDIMATNSSGQLWVYPSNGSSGWGAPTQVGWGWQGYSFLMSPGDFTGDGNPDVLTRDPNGTLRVYAGNGRNGWVSQTPIGVGWNTIAWLG